MQGRSFTGSISAEEPSDEFILRFKLVFARLFLAGNIWLSNEHYFFSSNIQAGSLMWFRTKF